MTKALLVFLGVVGVAVFASGQTAAPPDILADSIQRTSASTYQYRGHVQLTTGTVVVTADEADLTTQSNGALEFDLRGSVHLSTK